MNRSLGAEEAAFMSQRNKGSIGNREPERNPTKKPAAADTH